MTIKNSSVIYFWTKYVSVLLAAFVFVTGMMLPGESSAKTMEQFANELKSGINKLPTVKTFNDQVTVEGSQDLKSVKSVKDDYGIIKEQTFTGKVAKGKQISIRYLFKPISLEAINNQRRAILSESGVGMGAFLIKKRDFNVYIKTIAKKGNDNLEEDVSYKKDTLDNVMKFDVPEDATQVLVNIEVNESLYTTTTSQPTVGLGAASRKIITIDLKAVNKIVITFFIFLFF